MALRAGTVAAERLRVSIHPTFNTVGRETGDDGHWRGGGIRRGSGAGPAPRLVDLCGLAPGEAVASLVATARQLTAAAVAAAAASAG